MSIAMGTRLHINLYTVYKTTSVSILVLLSQNAHSYPLDDGLQGKFMVIIRVRAKLVLGVDWGCISNLTTY